MFQIKKQDIKAALIRCMFLLRKHFRHVFAAKATVGFCSGFCGGLIPTVGFLHTERSDLIVIIDISIIVITARSYLNVIITTIIIIIAAESDLIVIKIKIIIMVMRRRWRRGWMMDECLCEQIHLKQMFA